jgi:hypothetical protein
LVTLLFPLLKSLLCLMCFPGSWPPVLCGFPKDLHLLLASLPTIELSLARLPLDWLNLASWHLHWLPQSSLLLIYLPLQRLALPEFLNIFLLTDRLQTLVLVLNAFNDESADLSSALYPGSTCT